MKTRQPEILTNDRDEASENAPKRIKLILFIHGKTIKNSLKSFLFDVFSSDSGFCVDKLTN